MAITISAGVRQNLAALQATSALQSSTQNRLATGKKVNSALDNPSSFFTASGLNNRANDLGKLLDSMGQAVKTLEAADKGLKAVNKLVENAQSLANQAKATTEGKDTSAGAKLKIEGSATPTDAAIAGITAANTLTITVDGTATNIDVSGATNMSSLVSTINTAMTGKVTASATGGKLSLESDTVGASKTIAVSGADAATLFGSPTVTTAGADAVTTAVTADASRAKLAADFTEIRKQIDQLVKDSGYNGINLLKGDSLKVSFNEKGDSELNIAGKASDTGSTGLNVRDAANSWKNNTDVQAAIDDLKAATNTIRSSAASFGASLSIVQNRQDFTKGMIDTLNNGADELTNADMNQEAANLLALNTRGQLANSALSMASQQDQGILRLF